MSEPTQATQNASGGSGIPVPPPEFFQGKHWLYDTIMLQIEPDLTTGEIEYLDEKYAGETGEQRKERLAAYDKAFEIFEEVFKNFTDSCEKEAQEMHKKTQVKRKKEEQSDHNAEISDAEHLLQSDA